MEQVALAGAIRRAGQIQAVWRGHVARMRFRVLGLRLSMEEEALKGESVRRDRLFAGEHQPSSRNWSWEHLYRVIENTELSLAGSAHFPRSPAHSFPFALPRPAICFTYTGRKGWTTKSNPPSESGTPTPALPEGFSAQFNISVAEEAGGSNAVHDELAARIETSAANEGRRDGQLTPSDRPLVSKRFPSTAAESISAQKPATGAITEGVFDGAFCPTAVVSPPEHGHDSVAPTVVSPPTTGVLAAQSQTSPPEKYFIAFGHCLLAGAGTGASDEAAEEAATAGGYSCAADFGGASDRARVTSKKRARGYGDALEVFQEGLQRFPTSLVLLYGASLTMQARV